MTTNLFLRDSIEISLESKQDKTRFSILGVPKYRLIMKPATVRG
jgi:hypothetical protein